MSGAPIFQLYFVDDPVSFVNAIINPPFEGRLFLDLIRNSILGKLYWIGVFEIFQWHPVGGSIFPLDQQLPSCRGTFRCFVSIL